VSVTSVVGGGGYRRTSTSVPSDGYRPTIVSPQTLHTAALYRLCLIDGSPVLEVGVLFIAAADVRKGRTGNWKPREAVTGSWIAAVLTGNRSGELTMAAL
jgi:hypothetical protein